MKEIGGYLELELNHGEEYHPDALKLNMGRTSFEYVLRAKKVRSIFMPSYTCDVMFRSLEKSGVTYRIYNVDERLEPIIDFESLTDSDYFLYTNYFGVKDGYVKQLAGRNINLIIDNSQAFFSKPIAGIDTFYSPRKFFGVPDGGYLYTDKKIEDMLQQDISWERMDHLVMRIDNGAEFGYKYFIQNSEKMSNHPVKLMSKLTQALLCNIDFGKAKSKRVENFMHLHQRLFHRNEFKIDIEGSICPMVYPLLCHNGNLLKYKLIKNKIFVATYWKNVIESIESDQFEAYFTNNMVPLPVDQRYSRAEMDLMLEVITKNF